MASSFQSTNSTQQAPPDPTQPFHLTTSPNTDVWRIPPARDDFNAPIIYRSIPLSSFRRARVTVSANWVHQYDQGGLILVLPPSSQDDSGKKQRWVKGGIEVMHGRKNIAVVATDRWSDCSVQPLPTGSSLTLEFERLFKGDKPQGALWVWAQVEGGERSPVREVTWVFEDDLNRVERDMWIGVYAAKPYKESDAKDLEVRFEGLTIETA